jgi:hypothetical protein
MEKGRCVLSTRGERSLRSLLTGVTSIISSSLARGSWWARPASSIEMTSHSQWVPGQVKVKVNFICFSHTPGKQFFLLMHVNNKNSINEHEWINFKSF